MRRLAGAVAIDALVQQAVGHLPWDHIIALLNRLDDHELRDWSADAAATHGGSRNILEHQIKTSAHTRLQAAAWAQRHESVPKSNSIGENGTS